MSIPNITDDDVEGYLNLKGIPTVANGKPEWVEPNYIWWFDGEMGRHPEHMAGMLISDSE